MSAGPHMSTYRVRLNSEGRLMRYVESNEPDHELKISASPSSIRIGCYELTPEAFDFIVQKVKSLRP